MQSRATTVASSSQESNMQKDIGLYGGVSLHHTLVDGVHSYEVGNFLTDVRNPFAKKGDKLLKIDDTETRDLSPERLAKMLHSGFRILTLHQASIKADQGECPESDVMRPSRKEQIKLDFTMTMVREKSLEDNEESRSEEEYENDAIEDDGKALLVVSMTKTNVTVVSKRGCDSDNSCNGCCINGCSFRDVAVAAKETTVTTVRQYLKKHSERNLLIASYLNKGISSAAISPWHIRSCKEMSISENITIYYYMTNVPENGAPVVLNFTGSSNFLKCTCENQEIILTIECCDKEKLKQICENEPDIWPFVFYMSTSKDNLRRFESAANRGWFIKSKAPKNIITVANSTDGNSENFSFFIRYKS